MVAIITAKDAKQIAELYNKPTTLPQRIERLIVESSKRGQTKLRISLNDDEAGNAKNLIDVLENHGYKCSSGIDEILIISWE